jgi:putative membrane protein
VTGDALEPAVWHRLHPLSPLVRAGRATIGIAIVILPSVLTGRNSSGSYVELGVLGFLVFVGFVSWLVTRWRVEDGDLRIETGLVRRQSLRFPLAQVQAIDIVRPGLARLFGVAELRLRMAGNTGATARLAYLHAREAEPLRARLLALGHGAADAEPAAAPDRTEEHVLTSVPTGRLAASILLSDVGFVSILLLAGLIVAAFVAPSTAAAILGGGAAPILGALTLIWRRFNQEYHLTLAEAADGLRLRSGLVALTSETIRPGRVQAVRMVEPFIWRRLGWCRLEVDLAGRQRRKGEGEAERKQLRAVVPVGSRDLALQVLLRILPDAPLPERPAPRRVLLKSPLRFRFLSWGRSDTCVVARTGRIRRVTSWVPLAKAQSFRRVQGPLQRRLRLASVHVDTAGRALHATLRDRDVAEADEALAELVGLARAARRAPP